MDHIDHTRPGSLVGAMFMLYMSYTTLSVSSPSLPQVASWPHPAGVDSLKQQLAASEAKKGKDHPDLAEILFKICNAYRDEGGYIPATPYVERALSITEKTYGTGHVMVGATLDKLGTIFLAQGDTARARAAFVRAKPILLQALGRNKPGYGIFLMHLGELQLLAGQAKEAQETIDQALTAFGEELSHAAHEWTEVNRMMGILLLGLRKYEQAEQQLVYAVTIRSEAMSFENRDKAMMYMAPVKNSLGEFYVTVGRDNEAEPLLLEALEAYEGKYGKNHPLLENVLVNLAALYDGKRDTSKARQYSERVQVLHRKSAGYSHTPGWPLRTIIRVTLPARPLPTRENNATGLRLGAVTDTATLAHGAILMRLDAPVGRTTHYRTQTQSWLPGFSADSTKPTEVLTSVTTELITTIEDSVRIISAVVESSQFEMSYTQMGVVKDLLKGMTTVRRMDSRGRVLSTEVTREGEGMKDQGGNERILGESSVMPHAGGAFTLAEAPVRVGDSWTATERVYLGPGTGGEHADVQVSYKLERVGLKGGARVAVISMNGPVVSWLRRAGTGAHLRLEARPIGDAPPTGSMSGEIQIDLDATRIVGLTMNIVDRWGTPHGLKTRMTMTAQ